MIVGYNVMIGTDFGNFPAQVSMTLYHDYQL